MRPTSKIIRSLFQPTFSKSSHSSAVSDYSFKHFAPLGGNLEQHAQQIHDYRALISKSGVAPKVNTYAQSLPSTTTQAALVDKKGRTWTPSPQIIDTKKTPGNPAQVHNQHGPGYMVGKPYQDKHGQSQTHHETVVKDKRLPDLFEGNAPVTDPFVLMEKARVKSVNQKFLPLPEKKR